LRPHSSLVPVVGRGTFNHEHPEGLIALVESSGAGSLPAVDQVVLLDLCALVADLDDPGPLEDVEEDIHRRYVLLERLSGRKA